MTIDIFLFGTLLDEHVREVVFCTTPRLVTARLDGFRRCRLPDESYPVLVPHAGEAVTGLLALDVGSDDRARLDFFESDEYSLQACRVQTVDGRTVAAHFYAEGQTVRGASERWDLHAWQCEHKLQYLSMIRAYMALFGKAGRAEAEALWERRLERDKKNESSFTGSKPAPDLSTRR